MNWKSTTRPAATLRSRGRAWLLLPPVTRWSRIGMNAVDQRERHLDDIDSVRLSAATNQAPVVSLPSGANVSATAGGQVLQLGSLFSASDPNNDPLNYYILDNTPGTNSGHVQIGGVTQAEGQWLPVTQAQLSQTTFTAGQSGTDTFSFYVSDGVLEDSRSINLTVGNGGAANRLSSAYLVEVENNWAGQLLDVNNTSPPTIENPYEHYGLHIDIL